MGAAGHAADVAGCLVDFLPAIIVSAFALQPRLFGWSRVERAFLFLENVAARKLAGRF